MFMLMSIESVRLGPLSANRSGILGFPRLATLKIVYNLCLIRSKAYHPHCLLPANGEPSVVVEDKERDKENTHNSRQQEDDFTHPRKRKLRQRPEHQAGPEMQPSNLLPLHHHEKPENPYQLFLAIRRQVRPRSLYRPTLTMYKLLICG